MSNSNAERLKANDFADAMDFMDFVFSKTSVPHDMETLLSKLYHATDEDMQNIYVIRDDRSMIRSLVGSFPLTMLCGGSRLELSGIGGVSTHPRDRGKGHMSVLMTACVENMRNEGKKLSVLGGKRQRYAHFGYEKAGISASVSLIKSNLSYGCLAGGDGITFVPITPDRADLLEQSGKFNAMQPVCFERPSDREFDILTSWNSTALAAMDGNRMLGHLIIGGAKNSINELIAASEQDFLHIVGAYFRSINDNRLSINLQPWELYQRPNLLKIGENVTFSDAANWNIFDFEAVTGALMDLKASLTELADGGLTLDIDGWGGLEICVQNGKPFCAHRPGGKGIQMDAKEAIRLMMSLLSHAYTDKMSAEERRLCASWFPLPLGIRHTDNV